MNSTVKTCVVQVYEDNDIWIPVLSSISYGIGAIVCGSWMFSISKDARNQQKVWTIFGIFKAWIKILVISDRTFEMVLSTKKFLFFQITFYYCVLSGMDLAQIWITPSPEFCFLKNFIKNLPILMIAMSLSFTTVMKFYILVTKSVPEMDEIDIAKKALFCITSVSSILNGLKFSGDTKPTFNQVSFKMFTLQLCFQMFF